MYESQDNILGQKVNVKFFTVAPYPGSPTDFLPIFSRVFFEDVPNQLAYPLCSTVKKSQVIGRKVLERLVKVAIGKMGIGKKWLRSAVERSLGRCHPLNCIHPPGGMFHTSVLKASTCRALPIFHFLACHSLIL